MQKRESNICELDTCSFLRFSLPTNTEPLRTAGRTGARRVSARIGLYSQSYSSRAARDEREGQRAETVND